MRQASAGTYRSARRTATRMTPASEDPAEPGDASAHARWSSTLDPGDAVAWDQGRAAVP